MMFEQLEEDWWWTLTRRTSRCHVCTRSIPSGWVIAFNSNGGSVYCQLCAEQLGIASGCKPSRRFRQAGGRRTQQLQLEGSF